MEPLLWSISGPLSSKELSELKGPLFKVLWDTVSTRDYLKSHHALLNHYFDHLSLTKAYNMNLRTHEDVLRLIRFVKNNTTMCREVLQRELTESHAPILGTAPDSAERAIKLAVQLWLLLGTDEWDINKTLEEHIQQSFPRDIGTTANAMFPTSINVYTLERVGGFAIMWTENLQDHLSLSANNGQIELRIFHLTSFLEIYKNSQEKQIYPPGLVSETEQTIALLLPPTKIECKRWIRKARKEDQIDLETGVFAAVTRDLNSYPYWGKRLSKIIEEYEQAEPTSFKRWAVDKRRPNQRYTFWIAVIALVMALFFGLIQSVTGIIQAIVAAKDA